MGDTLNVYLLKQHVGCLSLDKKRKFLFQYEKTWLESDHALPLSLSLPLQSAVFEDDDARPFFANLLPESELRKVISLKLRVSEGNDFALLEAVGGECAGAVSLLAEGECWRDTGRYQPLNDDELNELVKKMPQRPMLVGEGDMRLSLAGAQNKLPVFYDQGVVSLPTGQLPSSHILKPPMLHFSDTVENEMFCMRLAKKMGLHVPEVTLLQKEKSLYLIERYDRRLGAGAELLRLHQEDFCQSLGIGPEMKYENEGGPSLRRCFQLIRNHSVHPIADVKALLQWTIFNYLIGNTDAHGKNLSFLFTEQGPELAPFYDLLSTVIYPDLSSKAAMKIGGEYRPDWVADRHWRRFAEEIDVNYKIVHQTIKTMSSKITAGANALRNQYSKEAEANEGVDKVIYVIEKRVRKVSMNLGLTV